MRWARGKSLNIKKYTSGENSKTELIDIKISNPPSPCPSPYKVRLTKFLGIIIDFKLSWKDQAKLVTSKMSKGIVILKKFRYCLLNESLKAIYFAFVRSHLRYGSV